MLTNIFSKLLGFFEYVEQTRYAVALSRIGEYHQAQELMKK